MFNSDILGDDPHDNTFISDCSCLSSLDSIDLSDCDCHEKKVKIPKIIMQTWKNHDVPDKWKISPKSIKKYMPDWEYVLMTDKDNRNFIKKHFPDFLCYYDGFTHNIMRADAIRYAWLYVKGGIYMDLDFEMKHSLDDLFTSDIDAYLVSSGNIGSCITNSFMASKPGCKLWLEMIEAMKEPVPWYYYGKHFEVMCSTGPMKLTNVVRKSTTVFAMLPGKLIMPCSACNITKCKAKGAYLKPLEGSSWITYDTKFYNFFLCNWKKVTALIIALFILLLIVLFIMWMDVL